MITNYYEPNSLYQNQLQWCLLHISTPYAPPQTHPQQSTYLTLYFQPSTMSLTFVTAKTVKIPGADFNSSYNVYHSTENVATLHRMFYNSNTLLSHAQDGTPTMIYIYQCASKWNEWNPQEILKVAIGDRPHFHGLYSYWKSKSRGLLPFYSTWDFCSHRVPLRTPALSFNRCAAPAKLPTWQCLRPGSAHKGP